MKYLIPLLLSAGAVPMAAPALAQHTAGAQEIAANAVDASRIIIRREELKPVTVYQWERDGKLLHAWPGEEKTRNVPYDASRVTVRLYSFPTGQLRLIDFPKGTRTHWHVNESDIIFYGLDLQQVEFVGRQVFDAWPGDVTFHPAGTVHHSESITGGTKAEFAFGPSGKGGEDMVAYSGRSQASRDLVEWVEKDRRMVAPATPGAAGSAFAAKSFTFPGGYQLVEAHYPAGSTIAAHTNAGETLLYVVSGRLQVASAGISGEIGPGDMVRLVGKPFSRKALADTVVLEVAGAKAP